MQEEKRKRKIGKIAYLMLSVRLTVHFILKGTLTLKNLSRKVHETGLCDLLTGSGRPRTSHSSWCSLEQSLIDDTVDQWPAHLRACV